VHALEWCRLSNVECLTSQCQVLQPLQILTVAHQSPRLRLADVHVHVATATARLQEIRTNDSSYRHEYSKLCDGPDFKLLGDVVEYETVHATVVVPYIDALLQNIGKCFGDSVGNVSLAARVFDPANAVTAAID